MTIVHQYERAQALQDEQQAAEKHANGKCNCCGQQGHPRDKCPHKNTICRARRIKGHIKLVCEANDDKATAYMDKQKSHSVNATNPMVNDEADATSQQVLCVTLPNEQAAMVSPYLSYMRVIFDASQPRSHPMDINCVLDTGPSVTIIHTRFGSKCNVGHNNVKSICGTAGRGLKQDHIPVGEQNLPIPQRPHGTLHNWGRVVHQIRSSC